jgi:protein TonB
MEKPMLKSISLMPLVLIFCCSSAALGDEVGTIKVIGSPGATVLLDGEEAGSIADSLGILVLEDVKAGAHSVVAQLEGYLSQAVTVWLAPGSERVARFREFAKADWIPPAPEPVPPPSLGSIAVETTRSTCAVDILELEISATSTPEEPWLLRDVVPGRYTARLFFDDSSEDIEVAVRPDSMTLIMVGFGSHPVRQQFLVSSSRDTSGFPFGRGERATPSPFDEPPQVIFQTPPDYPNMARMAELEGVVMVQIGVDESGNVIEAAVVQGIDGLNESAIDAVMKWKFRPARQKGVPVPARIVVPIRFTLRG